jgi:cytochrome c-type biogenesis protein CcmH/NrfG
MPDPRSHVKLMLALNAVETRLAAEPDSVELTFDRARCIQALGRERDALSAYRDVLALEPGHVRAMNAFGLLLLAQRELDEAEIVFAEAVARHPRDAESHANLAYVRAERGEHASARAHYEAALRFDPTSALAHHGLAGVLTALGETDGARLHRALGFAHRPLTERRYRGNGTPTRVLEIGSAADGNLVTRDLLDDRTFLVSTLVIEHYDLQRPLPPHDLVLNAIGEADACAAQLRAAAALLETTDAAVINDPRVVLETGRAAIARRLGALAGVVAPRIALLPRSALAGAAAVEQLQVGWPLLLRAPGFHGGDHFVQVETPDALPAALAALPGDELFALQFLDARGIDGTVRKYRVMLVDGALYPLHLALGREWKLHYFSAEMTSAAHRAEEAAFLADMPGALGARAMAALRRIAATLGLDYGGIDFGLDRDRQVLVFEANATMVVPPPPDDPRFAYRRPAVERILAAVRTMLLTRAGRPCSAR